MCEADSDGAVAPCGYSLGAFEPAQVTPVLLLLVIESIFECKCLSCKLLVLHARSCACEMSQGPADASYAVCKAAHPFRRVALGPVSLSIPMFSVFVQQISNLRSKADVIHISCFARERQQWNDGARTSGNQVMGIARRSCFGNLVRQFTGPLQAVAIIQSPTCQHKIGPDLRAKTEIRAGWKWSDLHPFLGQTFTLGLVEV